MNIQYVRYAIEVAKAGSFTKAAQNLFIAQSNLSNAIKLLEEDINITIFKRTSSGIKVTQDGWDFLESATQLIQQLDAFTGEYYSRSKTEVLLKVSSSRSSVSLPCILPQYCDQLEDVKNTKLRVYEGMPSEVIADVWTGKTHLGLLQYHTVVEQHYLKELQLKSLSYIELYEDKMSILMHRSHPLAQESLIYPEMIQAYTEVSFANFEGPIVKCSDLRKFAGANAGKNTIYIQDRATLFQILSDCPGAFAWSIKMPPSYLERYGLLAKEAVLQSTVREILIYPSDDFPDKRYEKLIDMLKVHYASLK